MGHVGKESLSRAVRDFQLAVLDGHRLISFFLRSDQDQQERHDQQENDGCRNQEGHAVVQALEQGGFVVRSVGMGRQYIVEPR